MKISKNIYIYTYEIYRVEVFQTFQDPKIINIQHYPASPIFLLKKLEAWNNETSNFSFTVGVDVGPCSFGKARDEVVFGLRFIYELRSNLCSWEVGHVQTRWSPIRCEGFS